MMTRDLQRRLVGAALCCVLLGACGQGGTEPPEAPKNFVVFTKSRLQVSQLGKRIPLPVTVGSSPSPETVMSDAPEVVSIDDAGYLVVHRPGKAVLRAVKQPKATLAIEVRVADSIEVIPGSVEIGVAHTAQLSLLDEQGASIPSDLAAWFSSAPDVATVQAGIVQAGSAPGRAIVTAVYGDQRATVRVSVAPSP